MSGWFGSGGLGILGSGMPRQQYDPEDDPMSHLYAMLGGEPSVPAAGVPAPPLRRMNGTPRSLFGGSGVGGFDPNQTAAMPSKAAVMQRGPSFQSQGMQRLADRMHQNNQLDQYGPGPYGNLSQSPQMQALRGLAQRNQASMTAMGNNGRFVRSNGMRSLPLASPNGNIDAELNRAQQIRADGRLAQGGMDQFTRKWRGINQNMPMPMEDDGVSPALADRRKQLMASMATANKARQGLGGTGAVPKDQLGMSIGGFKKGAMQDAYGSEKVRRQEAIARGQEFRQNRMAALAQQQASAGPDPMHALNAVMPFMMHPGMPGAQQHNATLLHMAGAMHAANVQAHGQNLNHQRAMAQMAQNGVLGMGQLGINAHAAGVNPNQVIPGAAMGPPNGQPAQGMFPNQPPPQFDEAHLPHFLEQIENMPDAQAVAAARQAGVTPAMLDRHAASNGSATFNDNQGNFTGGPLSFLPWLFAGESPAQAQTRTRRVEQAKRLRNLL